MHSVIEDRTHTDLGTSITGMRYLGGEKFVVFSDAATQKMAMSTDNGLTWTPRSVSRTVVDAAYASDTSVVGVGPDGPVWSSDGGQTWTESAATHNMKSVCWIPNYKTYCGVGASGAWYSADNGETWTASQITSSGLGTLRSPSLYVPSIQAMVNVDGGTGFGTVTVDGRTFHNIDRTVDAGVPFAMINPSDDTGSYLYISGSLGITRTDRLPVD